MKEVINAGHFRVCRATRASGGVGLSFVWDELGVELMLGPLAFEWWWWQ